MSAPWRRWPGTWPFSPREQLCWCLVSICLCQGELPPGAALLMTPLPLGLWPPAGGQTTPLGPHSLTSSWLVVNGRLAKCVLSGHLRWARMTSHVTRPFTDPLPLRSSSLKIHPSILWLTKVLGVALYHPEGINIYVQRLCSSEQLFSSSSHCSKTTVMDPPIGCNIYRLLLAPPDQLSFSSTLSLSCWKYHITNVCFILWVYKTYCNKCY